MATSGTSTYQQTRADIIRMALTDVGMIGPAVQVVDPSLIDKVSPYLDNLLKSMSRSGAPLWRIARLTLNVVAGTVSYALPQNVVDIDPPARFTQTGTTPALPVLPMPRKQYMLTSDRTVTGTPVQYYLERDLDASGIEIMTMYLYPTPSVSGVFEYAAVAKAQDSGTDANTLDIAQEWQRCVVLGLTADLSPMAKAGQTVHKAREDRFEKEFARMLNADVETGDMQEVVMGLNWGMGQW